MMQEKAAAAKKLSKAVLELKFMKKSKEKAIVQEENEERQQLYQDQLSSLHEGAEKIVMVNSYVDCFKFLPCRLSFGGMDPDVEKLNEDKLTGLYTVTKSAPKEAVTQMDADVSAQEMAARYRPSTHKPMPGCVKEEQEESVGESVPDAASTKHKKPKKPKLRAIFSGGTEEGRRGAQRGGRGGNLSGGGQWIDFKLGSKGHIRGSNVDGHRGGREGRAGDSWEEGRGSKGEDFRMKGDYPRESEQAATREHFGAARAGGKRRFGGGHYQQQGRDSPGQDQSCHYKKIKSDPN